jgi:hypothetical protein
MAPDTSSLPDRPWFGGAETGETIPVDCPVERSNLITSIRLTGRWVSYTEADTWFPSWAADGTMYSPWTDGSIGPWAANSKGVCAMTGHARIVGDDPMALVVEPLGTRLGSPGPYVGRYPAGSLVHDGQWYYGTYVVDEDRDETGAPRDVLGPFVGFRVSSDFGATWDDGPHTARSPIFGETPDDPVPLKIGSPRFVDLGCDLDASPDGYAYLVAFGGLPGAGHVSWILGDAVFLGRVKPSPRTINDPSAWQWHTGRPGQHGWASSLDDAQPIFTWRRSVGQVSMTRYPYLGRYLMCVSFAREQAAPTDSFILEAPSMVGPWRLVSYWPSFGPQAYFLNFPSRFLDPGGTRAWLCYSANHTGHFDGGEPIAQDPLGSRYALCLQEVEFRLR